MLCMRPLKCRVSLDGPRAGLPRSPHREPRCQRILNSHLGFWVVLKHFPSWDTGSYSCLVYSYAFFWGVPCSTQACLCSTCVSSRAYYSTTCSAKWPWLLPSHCTRDQIVEKSLGVDFPYLEPRLMRFKWCCLHCPA